MTRPRRNRRITRVTVPMIAVELGDTESHVRRLLDKHGWWLVDEKRRGRGRGSPATYDATVIEKLRGLLGQPARQMEEPESDWLSAHLGGTDARRA